MEWLQTFDIEVLQWLRETLSTPFMDKLMVLISTLGNAGALWLFLGVLFLIMGIRRKNWREMGILLLLCVGASALVCNLILKPCVNRIRPYDLLGYVDALLIPPLHSPPGIRRHASRRQRQSAPKTAPGALRRIFSAQ